MSMVENEAIARRFVNEHNLSGYKTTFEALLSPDCVVHEYLPGVPGSMERTGYDQFIAMFRAAIPDIHDTVEDVVAGADRGAIRWKGYGTHRGADLMGIPASGKQVTANGIYIFRFAGGKIV